MINKSVCFICNLDESFDINDIYNRGLGGSETWIINIANYISKYYHVIIFNTNNYTITYNVNKGIDIYPICYFDRICSYHYFEHVFFNRNIFNEYLDILEKYDNCQNIYAIVHDIHLWKNYLFQINNLDGILTNDDINNNLYLKEHLKKIFFMSDWHIDFNNICNYDNNLVTIIGNGIDIHNSIDYEIERDNNMLWSSCKERGLDIFIDKIMPRIKRKFPDFKLYISTYSNVPEVKSEYKDDIIFIGSLTKNDLYKEMQKHKVSYLPLKHWETFCITSIENIINGTIFLAPYKYGLKTIFKYFESLMLKDGDYNDEEYCDYITNEIIDKINNYKQYINIQKVLYSYIKDNYSWETIFDKLHNIIKIYEKDNSYYM